MSPKLRVARTADSLLRSASARYTVAAELERLDTASTEDLSAEERLQASQRFNQLVQAENLKRKMARTSKRLETLRDSGLQQVEYEAHLGQQLSTAQALYKVLAEVSRALVQRPDGTYVRMTLIRERDELYAQMNWIRRELEGPPRPQDV